MPVVIDRRERAVVGLLIVGALAAVFGTVVYAAAHTPPGASFLGLVGLYPNDYMGYFAWMRQAEDGHVLMRNLFTTEPHGRAFFHPLFLVMGLASRLTGASPIAVWYVVHALACVVMLAAIHRLAAWFVPDAWTRVLAVVLAATSAGLGWTQAIRGDTPMVGRAVDLWLPEANAFQAMTTWFFTLPAGLAFMLLAMHQMLRYLDEGGTRRAVAAGVYALALATVHQYDVVTLYAVLGVWTIMAGRRRVPGMLVVLALSLPYCVYSVLVVTLDPVLSRVSFVMPSPTVGAYLLGGGIPLGLAVVALAMPAVWRENRQVGLLVAWLVVNAVLLAAPIGFQRKLMWGLHVPICLLAAMGVGALLRAVVGGAIRSWPQRAVVGSGFLAVIVLCGVGSADFYRMLLEHAAWGRAPHFLADDAREGLEFLDRRVQPGDVVLASHGLADLVPRWTGQTVFQGHWAQTIDPQAKQQFMITLFQPQRAPDVAMIDRVLTRNRVRYLILDAPSARAYRTNVAAVPFAALADQVFANDAAVVWQVRGYARDPRPASWTSGDWRGP